MNNQNLEVISLLSKAERDIYTAIQQDISRLVQNQSKMILSHQKIIIDEYESEPLSAFISRLYKQVFGVQFVGELPPALVLINKYNNLHMRPISKKKPSQKNTPYKNIQRIYNKRYYQNVNVDENRALFKFQEQSKIYLMDLDLQQQGSNLHLIKLLFTIYTATERKQVSEQILKLTELFVNSFEERAMCIFQKNLRRRILNPSEIFIEDRPILTLLLNRMYYDYEIINRQHRKILNCTRASKYNTRIVVFIEGLLYYNNVEYYLNRALKKKIINEEFPTYEEVIEHLQFSQEDTFDIEEQAKIDGYFTPSHKRWNILVDKSLNYIELSFQIESSQCFGSSNVDERAYLDLFAMVIKIVQAPIHSQKNLKSQKAIIYHQKSQEQVDNFLQLQSILLTAFEFAPKVDYQQFQFNILDYDAQTTIRIVYQMLYSRFKEMELQQQKLQRFIKQIGNMYQIKQNAFHNIYHAFTVLHGAHIISKSEVFGNIFDEEVMLTFMIAAYCHDVCHTGVTNFFEQKTTSKLANRYGDRSILEYNSIAKSLDLLTQQQYDFLAYMPQKSWTSFRKLFIESILATDNKYHFQTYSSLESALSQNSESLGASETSAIIGGLLHTVDFWGVIKDFKVSYAWSKLVNNEFDKQYHQEAKLQIQQTPYFKDVSNDMVIAKNQQMFVTSIVTPLFKKVNQWSNGHIKLALQRIDENLAIWKRIESGQDQAAKYL